MDKLVDWSNDYVKKETAVLSTMKRIMRCSPMHKRMESLTNDWLMLWQTEILLAF